MNTANIDTEHIHCVPAMYELSNDIKTNVAEQVVYKMMQRKVYIYFLFYLLIVVFLESHYKPKSSPQTPEYFLF